MIAVGIGASTFWSWRRRIRKPKPKTQQNEQSANLHIYECWKIWLHVRTCRPMLLPFPFSYRHEKTFSISFISTFCAPFWPAFVHAPQWNYFK